MFQSLQNKILSVFVILISCSILLIMFIVSAKVKDAMVQAENKSAKNLLEIVMLNVESQYNTTCNQKQELIDDRKNQLKERVNNVLTFINAYYELSQLNLLSEGEAKKFVLSYLKKMRYDEGAGYIWITNTAMPYPRIMMHPTESELNGVFAHPDLLSLFADNIDIFNQAVSICESEGSGYMQYTWGQTQKKKLSYVASFAKWNWIIGSAIYLDDLEIAANTYMENALKALRETLQQVRVAESGYVFVFTGDKEMLIHPNLGELDFAKIQNPGKKTYILDDLMKAAHSESKSFDYIWDKLPNNKGEYRFRKRAFVAYFEPLDWYIASSVYNADVALPSQLLTRQILIVGIILLLTAVVVVFVLASHLTKPLENLRSAARKIQLSGIHSTNIPVGGSSEIKELGIILGDMLGSIKDADSEKETLVKDLEKINKRLREINKKLHKEISERKYAEKALRESEEKYKGIVENTIDTIMLSNPDGTISYLSPACKDVLGHDSESLSDTLLPISHPDDINIARFVQEQFLAGKSGTNVEYRIITSHNRVKWISCSWSPVLQDKSIYMIVSVIRDITTRKNMEEELIKAHKMESLGIFAGGIAHDFNNLMMAMLGNLAIAKMEVTSDSAIMKNLENTEKSIRRASKLSQQLLAFSKWESTSKKVIALTSFIEEYINSMVRDSNIQVEFLFAEDLWHVDVDKHHMRQVFTSITENAMQAMNNEGLLTVSASNITVTENSDLSISQGEYVEIAVKDQGVGIAEEYISKIFDPYFTTKEKSALKGTGLGLATVYSIIRQHGGCINVDSQISKGTTFYIYLPAAKKVEEKKEDTNKLFYGKGNILVIDDDDSTLDVLSATLERLGYDVKCADTLESAIEYYEESIVRNLPFDMIVMDFSMPGAMDTRDMLQELQKINSKLKVILTSEYEDSALINNCQNYGCCGFLCKPIDIYSLSSTMHLALQGQQTK